MRYLKCIRIIAFWLVVPIVCARAQNVPEPVVEDPKAPIDSKATESYWTEERMNKAEPMPTPTVIIQPKGPEAPACTSGPDACTTGPESVPGGKPGSQ